MKLVRFLKYNIFFKASHIAGINNAAADHLFRLQMEQFRESEKCNTFVPQLIAPYFNCNYNREKFIQSNVITLPIIVPSNSKPLSSKNIPKT
jgi:hypothetical protein